MLRRFWWNLIGFYRHLPPLFVFQLHLGFTCSISCGFGVKVETEYLVEQSRKHSESYNFPVEKNHKNLVPKTIKTTGCEFGVANGVLDVDVPKVILNCAGVGAFSC